MTPASVGFQCPDDVRAGNAAVRPVKRAGGLRTASRRWGPVTIGLIAANVVMFLVTAVSAGLSGSRPLDNYRSPVFQALSQVPLLVDLGEVWRLVTAAFLHIGPLHLVLNMLGLLVFGSELERGLGRGRFAALYAVSVLGGAAAIQLFGDYARQVAGASTAIYGMLGALAVLMVFRRQDVRGILTLLAINVLVSFFPGVSLLGHLGGLVAGAAAAGVIIAARRRPALQAAGLAGLALLFLVLCLAVSSVVPPGV
jgi:membrane associated rhomboid family serine protease